MISYRVFLDLAIILVAAKLLGVLARKLHLPQVVGMLLAGLLIGPNCFGWVQPSDFLANMAEIGVIMLMFIAGLETNLKDLKRTGLAALVIAAMGVLVPLVGGFFVYSLCYGMPPVGDDRFYTALFVGVIITATSVSITVETLREMGRLKGKVGTTILSAAIIDDVIGIIALTFIIAVKQPDANPVGTIISTVIFFVLALVIGVVVNRIFRYFDKRYPHQRRVPIYSLAICLFFAYAAEEFFGIADITGAYVAGIMLCNIREAEYIERKIDISSYMLFAPIFFTGIGIKIAISGMNASLILFTVLLVLVAMLSKFIGCGAGALMTGYSLKDAARIGTGMIARGEVCLIVAQKGLAAGLMPAELFTAVIFIVIVCSVSTPILLKMQYSTGKKKKEVVTDEVREAAAKS